MWWSDIFKHSDNVVWGSSDIETWDYKQLESVLNLVAILNQTENFCDSTEIINQWENVIIIVYYHIFKQHLTLTKRAFFHLPLCE